jgi:hypothetical protein
MQLAAMACRARINADTAAFGRLLLFNAFGKHRKCSIVFYIQLC